MSLRTALCLAMGLLVVIFAGCESDTRVKLENGLKVGSKFPSLEGKNIYGRPVKLSDYHGKVILLNFFGDW